MSTEPNSPEYLLRHCLAYLREQNADGPGLLVWRIRNSKGARVPTETDRQSAYYQRHIPPHVDRSLFPDPYQNAPINS